MPLHSNYTPVSNVPPGQGAMSTHWVKKIYHFRWQRQKIGNKSNHAGLFIRRLKLERDSVGENLSLNQIECLQEPTAIRTVDQVTSYLLLNHDVENCFGHKTNIFLSCADKSLHRQGVCQDFLQGSNYNIFSKDAVWNLLHRYVRAWRKPKRDDVASY